MKKALALILSILMVLALVPAVVLADAQTANLVTDPTTLATGDKVVLYAPAYSVALSSEILSTYYRVGVAVTAAEGKLSVEDTKCIWDLTVNADGTFQFANGTDLLVKSEGYNSFATSGALSNWTVEAHGSAENAFLLSAVDATKGKSYIEWNASFSDFTAYAATDVTGDAFAMQFYKIEEGGGEPAPTPDSESIVILYTNDAHCEIGYYESVAGYKKLAKAAYDNVAMVDAGDYLQGGVYGALSKGSAIVELMNDVGYDVVTLGNHEFDYGMDRLMALMGKDATYTGETMNAEVVDCNFVNLADDSAVFAPYTIKEMAGKKVAFIGITTPEAISKSTPAFFQNEEGTFIYGFHAEDLAVKIQASIDAAKAAGADYVIALGHLGIDDQSQPNTSLEIIAQLSGLTAFIDGHSHTVMTSRTVADKDGNDVVLTQTGTKLANLGKMVIAADGTITTELIPLVANYTSIYPDAELNAAVAAVKAPYAEMLAEVVGTTENDQLIYNADSYNAETGKYSERWIRKYETNLGDLCADAYLNVLDADIAFVNGGGIRANILKGDITVNDLLSVHPYGNSAVMIEVTGQEILDALEHGSRNATSSENGGFLQVAGLTYEIHTYKTSVDVSNSSGLWTGTTSTDPADYKVQNVKVLNKTSGEYEPLDLTKTYKLASHDYMLQYSGDGYTMFADNEVIAAAGIVDYQVIEKYIKEKLNGVVGAEYADPKGQGRIKIVTEPVMPTYDYSYNAPVVYSNDAMVEVFAVTYKVATKTYTDYVCTPTDYANAAAIATTYDVDAAAVVSQGSFVRYDITLSDIGAALISSGKFVVEYDTTKLELAADYQLYNTSDWVVNATGNEFLASTAYAHGVAQSENKIIYSLYFNILEAAADGDVIPVTFTTTELGLVNADEVIIEPETYTVGGYDGSITIGSAPAPAVDKSALQAAYNADKAAYDAAAVGDPNTMADGTSYLSEADAATDKTALEAALAVLNNANATQEEVNAALAALNSAWIAPKVVSISTAALEAAIAYAKEFMASDKYEKCSDELKAKWAAALAAAEAELANQQHTQNSCDDAANAIKNLKKTGESTIIFVFAGMGVLAICGLAIVAIRRRRFN